MWMGVTAERQAGARWWGASDGRGYAIGNGDPSRHFWNASNKPSPRVWSGQEMGWEGYGFWTCVSALPLVSSVMPHSLLHLSELPFSICKIKTISTPWTYGKDELRKRL